MRYVEPAAAAKETKQPAQWRDRLVVHPAAELFPEMDEAELRKLADNIEENGLLEQVNFMVQDGVPVLLDGRNRLTALQLLGEKIFISKYDDRAFPGIQQRMTGRKRQEFAEAETEPSSLSLSLFKMVHPEDPLAFIIGKNILRRHLTPEQKRELIAKVLKASPELSDRQIGKLAKADGKTVAAVRAEKEARAEIPHGKTRKDTKGRQQPARKPKPEPKPEPIFTESAEVPIDDHRAAMAALDQTPEEKASELPAEIYEAFFVSGPDSSEHALSAFDWACRVCLPKMTEADQRKARLLVSELTSVKAEAA